MAADKEILASVKPGKPPADCPVLGTWRLRTYVRERLSDGQRHNQFGEAPVGYIGYAPDGRMYAIFTRDDRVVPRIRHFVLEGDTLTITTAPYKSYLDGTMGRSILVWSKVE